MSEQTTSSIVITSGPDQIMSVIADFESYPAWATGVSVAEVTQTDADGQPVLVYFSLDVPPIKDEYTLRYDWQSATRVEWTLEKATLLRSLDGSYEINDLGDGTCRVTYTLKLDLLIPFIGMIKRKGEKLIIDAALSGLKSRVESLAAS